MRKDWIVDKKSFVLGGNNCVDFYTLKNGKVLCINEDMVSIYESLEDAETTILDDGEDLSIHNFYF